MAILTKPSVSKGTVATFTLNKTELAQITSVTANTYFSNSSNWKKVKVHYISLIGNQREVVVFDATETTPSAQFLVSLKARSNFEVKHIIIEDFDGGIFKINRSELANPVSDFDISFA
jgi:hypothetical protein